MAIAALAPLSSIIVAVALGGCSAALAAQRITPADAVASLPADSPDLPTLRVEPVVAHAFRLPVGAVPSPVRAGRWYVLEQGGTIVRFDEGAGAASVALFADLTGRVDTSSVESGLLGFAFDPAYERTGRAYISAVARGLVSRLSRFTVSAATDTLDPTSERVLLELQQPGDVHNGGKITFGPDGFLYLGLGDGAQGLDPLGHGQNPATLFATVLRLDVGGDAGYRVPPDNPFVGGGGRPEVFAYGFRNPWGIAFDRETGALWVADVGESDREEVDVVVPGGNYGWSLREGTRCVRKPPCDAPGLVDPVYEYTHADGCSITGGTVYRGRKIPWLRGAYVFSDWCAGTVWALFRAADGRARARVIAATPYGVTALPEDGAGELHLLDYTRGGFYRLVP